MTTCCLCSNRAASAVRQSWDNPVFESRNFAAIPSLGSLVEGWLLLVPKKHFISMGALPEELVAEMEGMKAKITAHVGNEYGEACVFEHGPAFASRKVGCSVDHAHLHIVPFAFNLAEAARLLCPMTRSGAKLHGANAGRLIGARETTSISSSRSGMATSPRTQISAARSSGERLHPKSVVQTNSTGANILSWTT
jgi:diadenosine tetraphosphate (Ap4A) HIT family hydrolase